MELYLVILNSVFRTFLVRILIQKDNTNDKIFENKFYIKPNKTKQKTEKKKYCKFVIICGKLSVKKCPLNKVLWIFAVFVVSLNFFVEFSAFV